MNLRWLTVSILLVVLCATTCLGTILCSEIDSILCKPEFTIGFCEQSESNGSCQETLHAKLCDQYGTETTCKEATVSSGGKCRWQHRPGYTNEEYWGCMPAGWNFSAVSELPVEPKATHFNYNTCTQMGRLNLAMCMPNRTYGMCAIYDGRWCRESMEFDPCEGYMHLGAKCMKVDGVWVPASATAPTPIAFVGPGERVLSCWERNQSSCNDTDCAWNTASSTCVMKHCETVGVCSTCDIDSCEGREAGACTVYTYWGRHRCMESCETNCHSWCVTINGTCTAPCNMRGKTSCLQSSQCTYFDAISGCGPRCEFALDAEQCLAARDGGGYCAWVYGRCMSPSSSFYPADASPCLAYAISDCPSDCASVISSRSDAMCYARCDAMPKSTCTALNGCGWVNGSCTKSCLQLSECSSPCVWKFTGGEQNVCVDPAVANTTSHPASLPGLTGGPNPSSIPLPPQPDDDGPTAPEVNCSAYANGTCPDACHNVSATAIPKDTAQFTCVSKCSSRSRLYRSPCLNNEDGCGWYENKCRPQCAYYNRTECVNGTVHCTWSDDVNNCVTSCSSFKAAVSCAMSTGCLWVDDRCVLSDEIKQKRLHHEEDTTAVAAMRKVGLIAAGGAAMLAFICVARCCRRRKHPTHMPLSTNEVLVVDVTPTPRKDSRVSNVTMDTIVGDEGE